MLVKKEDRISRVGRAMSLSKLNLSPRDEALLVDMGFDTIEKIALAYSDELGLGRRRGEAVQERARRILARYNIKSVSLSEDFVSVELLKASKGVVVCRARV